MKIIHIKNEHGQHVAEGCIFADGQCCLHAVLERRSQSLKFYGTYQDILLDYKGCEIKTVPIEMSTGMEK